MRDPELAARTNRRAYVLPRQISMYIARQLTGTSLQEIGRDAPRRTDDALNRTITQLMDAFVTRA